MCFPWTWFTKRAQLIMGTWPIYKNLQLLLTKKKQLSFDKISPRDFYFFPFFSICTCLNFKSATCVRFRRKLLVAEGALSVPVLVGVGLLNKYSSLSFIIIKPYQPTINIWFISNEAYLSNMNVLWLKRLICNFVKSKIFTTEKFYEQIVSSEKIPASQ